jgi:hypothetical protein
LLGEVMARKGAQKRLFRPRPPARQAVRVGAVPAGRPRLPSPAAPFAHSVRRGAATLGPFAPAGLKPLTIGLGSRRLRRRHAGGPPSPGPSGGPLGRLRRAGRPFGEYVARLARQKRQSHDGSMMASHRLPTVSVSRIPTSAAGRYWMRPASVCEVLRPSSEFPVVVHRPHPPPGRHLFLPVLLRFKALHPRAEVNTLLLV